MLGREDLRSSFRSWQYLQVQPFAVVPPPPSVQAGRRLASRATRTGRPGLAHPHRTHLHHHTHPIPDLTTRSTGGLHAAGLFTADGTLLVLRGDVGRHNAASLAKEGGLTLVGFLRGTAMNVYAGAERVTS